MASITSAHLSTLFGDTIVTKTGTVPVQEALAGKTIGIYFSAHWCGPCRGFTPQLAQYYKAIKAKHPRFEIVFASSDRDDASFQEYYSEMPWLALPYADRARKDALSKKYSTLCLVVWSYTVSGSFELNLSLLFPLIPPLSPPPPFVQKYKVSQHLSWLMKMATPSRRTVARPSHPTQQALISHGNHPLWKKHWATNSSKTMALW